MDLSLTKFVIENISLPAEVEAAMDKRTSMGVIGDVGRYAQFQAADAMRDAAQNTGGGGAATGAGLGAGFAIGNAMAGAMSNAMNQSKNESPSGARRLPVQNVAPQIWQMRSSATECGAKMETSCANRSLRKMRSANAAGSKFCNECGTKVE